MSIGTTGKLFFHNSQLLLYTKRFWFSLALNWFSLILNLKMLLQVTIRSIIQGKVTSAWGQGKHHSYIPCYCKMCCESIENMQPLKFTTAVGICRGKQCFYSNHLSKNIAEVIISQQNIYFCKSLILIYWQNYHLQTRDITCTC